MQNNRCVSEWEGNHFEIERSDETRVCKKCHESCDGCKDEWDQCIKCVEGYKKNK